MNYQKNPILEFFGVFRKDKYDLMINEQLVKEAKLVIVVYRNREIPRIKKYIKETEKKIQKITKKPFLLPRKPTEFDLQELEELKASLKNAYAILNTVNTTISDLLVCIASSAYSEIKTILKRQPEGYDYMQKLIVH